MATVFRCLFRTPVSMVGAWEDRKVCSFVIRARDTLFSFCRREDYGIHSRFVMKWYWFPSIRTTAQATLSCDLAVS